MTYELMREIAGSWMLLVMFLFFVGMLLWVFRPGAAAGYRDGANIVFRNENAPAPDPDPGEGESRKEART